MKKKLESEDSKLVQKCTVIRDYAINSYCIRAYWEKYRANIKRILWHFPLGLW